MHGIVSVLEPDFYRQVEAIWNGLENRFGISGVRVTPVPHFSWQVADDYDFGQAERSLRDLAESLSPFVIETAGIGVFGGPAPVIFVKIPRTVEIDRVHLRLWNDLLPYRHGESPYYHPDEWTPHITLAEKDVTPETLDNIKEYLSSMSFRWRISVSNVGVIYQPKGSIGRLSFSAPFDGGRTRST